MFGRGHGISTIAAYFDFESIGRRMWVSMSAKRSDALSVKVLWDCTPFGQVHKKKLPQKNFVPYFKFWSTKLSAPVEHPTSPARQHSHPSQRQCGLRPSKPFYFCWCGPVGNSSGNFALLCAAWYKKRGKGTRDSPSLFKACHVFRNLTQNTKRKNGRT